MTALWAGKVEWIVMVGLIGAACGGGSAGPDASVPQPCPTCQLTAIEPEMARLGEIVTLEGTFSGDVSVRFADGEVVPATVLGAHRAIVPVPVKVTDGDLALVAGTTTTGKQRFRRTTFALGMAPFETTPVTTGTPRTAPVLASPSFGAASLAIGSALYVIGGGNGGGTSALDTIDRALINADGTLGAFAPLDGKLSAPRRFHTVTRIGDRVYAIGGADILTSGLDNSVEQATINPDGSLGVFATVAEVRLSVLRDQHTATVIGNQLYIIGGNGPGGPLADLEHAEIRTDGSLAAFTRVADVHLVTARAGHTSAVIGNYLYVVGGRDEAGGPLSTIERAAISGDGTLGPFEQLDGGLFRARSGHTMAVLGGAVYVYGGMGVAGDLGTVERAQLQADGSLGAFQIVPEVALATPRFAATSVIVRDYLYVIGGEQAAHPTVPLASIERAGLISTDKLEAMAVMPAPKRIDFGAGPLVLIGNYSYEIGGLRGGVNQYDPRIARATYDANGELSAYEFVPGLSLNYARASHRLAVVGRYVYVLGGQGDPLMIAPTERAEILADGSLGPFTIMENPKDLQSLLDATIAGNTLYLRPVARPVVRVAILPDGSLGPAVDQPINAVDTQHAFGAQQIAIGGSFYLLGGEDKNVPLNNVIRLTIGSDGVLSNESNAASLPYPLGGAVVAVMGDQLYLIGGNVVDPSGSEPSMRSTAVLRATIHGDGSLSAFTSLAQYPELDKAELDLPQLIGNYAYVGSVRFLIGSSR